MEKKEKDWLEKGNELEEENNNPIDITEIGLDIACVVLCIYVLYICIQFIMT